MADSVFGIMLKANTYCSLAHCDAPYWLKGVLNTKHELCQ